MFKFTKTTQIAAGFLVAATFVGCKPMTQEDGSSVKTVDNFVAGSKVTVQSCGPVSPTNSAQLSSYIVGGTAAQRSAAIQSLAAAPSGIRGAVFGDKLKGKIHIASRDELKTVCVSNRQNKFVNENASSYGLCIQKNANEPIRLYVAADEAVIRHGVLRLITYVYLDSIERSLADANSEAGDVIVKALRDARGTLSSVFLKELGAASKYAAASNRLHASRQANASAFDNELFVEMVDSVYCSARSMQTFRGEFSKSFDQFVGRTGSNPINFTKILGTPWHAR